MSGKTSEKNVRFYQESGKDNTLETFEAVAARVENLDLNYVIVATTTGETGAKAVEFFEDIEADLIVVAHQYGFRSDGKIELEDEYRDIIEDSSYTRLVVTPDILTRVPKIARGKYDGFTYLDMISDTLKLFSEGMKVCVECTIQAADSGNVSVNEEIAVMAGTGKGADTGVILESKHSHKLFDIDVKEIVCMPRNR